MTKIKLKRPQHLSDGRIGRAGQVFDIEENRAAYLVGMGKAELTTEKVSPLPPKYESTAKLRDQNERTEAVTVMAKALKEALAPEPKKSKKKAEDDFPVDDDADQADID